MRRLSQLFVAGAVAIAVACSASDPGITTAVKSKLATDDTVKAYQIDVDTQDRVVTLTGTVATADARDRALEIARGVDGVARVEDRLTVSTAATIDEQEERDLASKSETARERAGDTAATSGAVLTDAGITTAVKTRLLADPDVAGLKIDVDTKDNVVTLTGTVATAAQKTEAGDIAKDTTGVTRVVNNLKVGSE